MTTACHLIKIILSDMQLDLLDVVPDVFVTEPIVQQRPCLQKVAFNSLPERESCISETSHSKILKKIVLVLHQSRSFDAKNFL